MLLYWNSNKIVFDMTLHNVDHGRTMELSPGSSKACTILTGDVCCKTLIELVFSLKFLG